METARTRPLATPQARRALAVAVSLAFAVALLPAAPSQAQQSPDDRFPSDDPDPRAGTPDDPSFDCAEPDDEDDVDGCTSIYDQQTNLFGFAPFSTRPTALYKDLARSGEGQIGGISADLAWKTTIGSPQAVIAVLDSGIRWDHPELRTKVWLNRGELPLPRDGAGNEGNPADEVFDGYDLNGDGVLNVEDYADDPRVLAVAGDDPVTAQHLIQAFSDGEDTDGNGYVDDIAGWDFLDDDNDPFDASSYSSSVNHGDGRMREAASLTNNALSGAGVCPECMVMAVRVWDTFVVPGDQYAMGTVYAADNGAHVQTIALGGLQNTRTAKEATRYAYERGMALMQVSSDLNTANHNYPTNYVETTFVNGCVPDTEGMAEDIPGLSEFLADTLGILTQPPVQTYFRQSNLTQHGAHAHICTYGVTGSAATGQAAGAAGMVVSRGLEVADAIGGPLTSNEVKQILTMTAEDVLPENTLGTGVANRATPGWDEHFGYGRVHLADAVNRVAPGTIPPEALVTEPAWFAMLDPVAQSEVVIRGEVAARRSASFDYELEWAPGVEPADGEFTTFAVGAGTHSFEGVLGTLDMTAVAAAIPGSTDGTPPSGENDYLFTVRLVVTDADGNRGEDRKAWFAFHDPTLLPGWPRFADSGGETSPVLYDLAGDGRLEIVVANSSGELEVLRHDGTPWAGFNGGQPWVLPPQWNHNPDAPGFASGAVRPPTGGWRTPAIADIDADLSPDIVAAAGDGRLFAFERDGTVKDGFPVSVDPELSRPEIRTRRNHVKRGILASPTLADLDGDGRNWIVAAALDGHVYVWSPAGVLRAGFPVKLADPDEDFDGGELINTPALADLTGDGRPEIVLASTEVYGATVPGQPQDFDDVVGGIRGLVTNLLANAIGGSTRLYALDGDGEIVDGWPVALNGLLPDILPLVGPGHTVAVADLSGDGVEEVVASATTSDVHVVEADGEVRTVLRSDGAAGQTQDPSKVLNLFEYPVVGDLLGAGTPSVVKGGLTTGQVLNLLLVGQNLPFDHVVQVWDGATGEYLPGWPRATSDYMLLSTPTIADVTGDGLREVLVGTGLYRIHAYDVLGQEADGFPKFTGGWNFGVPAIGDLDGDGTLDLVGWTREGWQFAWSLDGDATPEANREWWTEGHDECHTNRYGTDCRPPSPVRDLAGSREGDDVAVSFTATGDDWLVGTAEAYEVRWATEPIGDFAGWQAATPLAAHDVPAPSPSGEAEQLAIAGVPQARSVAVVARDAAGNSSQIAAATFPAVGDDPDDPVDPGGPGDPDGPDGPIDPDEPAVPGVPGVLERVAGADRVATAAAISARLHDRATTVVLARSDDYADALAGAPLAAHLGAPLLLTAGNRLSSAARTELDRLGARNAVLLGGTAALGPGVEADLAAMGVVVRRIDGANRFDTAARVAGELPEGTEVFVAEGAHADPGRGWPDAVSASGLAAAERRPVLLVTRDRLPAETAAALPASARVVVVGGRAAVGDDVAAALRDVGASVVRLSGATRYATSAAVVDAAVARGVDARRVWVATGRAFPDGLVAGAAAGTEGGVLLLVDGVRLDGSPPTRDWLTERTGTFRTVRIAGGRSAISEDVERDLRDRTATVIR